MPTRRGIALFDIFEPMAAMARYFAAQFTGREGPSGP